MTLRSQARQLSTAALVLTAVGTSSAATWRLRATVYVPAVRPAPAPLPRQIALRTLVSQPAAPDAGPDLLAIVRARTGGGPPLTPAAEVDRWILRLATDAELREGLESSLGRMSTYEPLIRETLRRYRLPEELMYLVMVESEVREGAVSHAGAAGMWQFMPATGRLYDLEVSRYVDERRDPVRSTVAAVRHLGDLHAEFGSWHLALAAYNAGSGRVARALGRYAAGKRGDEVLYWQIRPHLPRETQRYVPLYLAAAQIARRPRDFGLRPSARPTLAFDEVWTAGGVALDSVAKTVGAPPASLHRLNPQLIRGMTPPGRRWPVRVPRRPEHPATLAIQGT